MLFSKIDKLGDSVARVKEVRDKITAKNYNGASRGEKGKGWSLTDVVQQQEIATSAIEASAHISGVTKRGKNVKGKLGKPLVVNVKLKVLTRQACFKDSNGNRIEVDPTEEDMTLEGVKPVEGDIVRVRGEQITTDENGTALTFAQREYMASNGTPQFEFEEEIVDEDGCITVSINDARHMLRNNGYKIRRPSHRKPHTSIENKKEAIKRRLTNWHFEEVNANYTAPVEPKPAPKPKPAPNQNQSGSN